MNILLWIVQVALAFLTFSGGAFKITSFDKIAAMPAIRALPRAVWTTLGGLEMLCAVLLIIPAAMKWKPLLTPFGATVLAIESLALALMYARYSLRLTAANPLVWVAGSALMAAFVAYGRYTLSPVA